MLSLDLVEFLRHKKAHSERTFGPSQSTRGICNHIRKELEELERDPFDGEEWVDVLLLALDGLWRAGYSPEEAVALLVHKQFLVNERREWPDWRKLDPDDPIEHLRRLKEQRCDGNHGRPPCADPECWLRYEGEEPLARSLQCSCRYVSSMGGQQRVLDPGCPEHGDGESAP